MPLPQVTATGNVTADPELRFSQSGAAVVNLTVACNYNRKNEQTQEWETIKSIFLRCSAWKDQAESIAEQVKRGDAVTVTGRLSQNDYEDRDGNKRVSYNLDIDTIALTVKRVPAQRQQGQQGSAPPQRDPWASPSETAQQNSPWGGQADSSEPPF